MKKLGLLALILVFLSASAARAQDVTYNYAQGEDFSKYKTYKWVSIKNADPIDEITAKQLTATIDSSLRSRDSRKRIRIAPTSTWLTKPLLGRRNKPMSISQAMARAGDMAVA